MKNIYRLMQQKYTFLLCCILMIVYKNTCADVLSLKTLTNCLSSLSSIAILKLNKDEKFDFNNTVISIEHMVENFNKRSSCNVHVWANKLENSCKCCLIQNAIELDNGKKPSEVMQICLNKNECNAAVIHEMLHHEGLIYKNREKNIRELIAHLFEKSVIIKEVFPHDIKFNHDGTFTTDAAVKFLVQAYQENKLKNPNFRSGSCLKIQDIMNEKGFMTSQLFSITSQCLAQKADYILKEMASGSSEVIFLKRSSLIPGLASYIYPASVPEFPSFILPVAYLSYNYAGKEHYLSLMLKSPGLLLSSLAGKYKNKVVNTADIEQAYYQAGFTLSHFHQKFMTNFKSSVIPGRLLNHTYVQGDAHQSNIFYDKATNRVIFIDNEKFTIRSPTNPFVDIETFVPISLKLFTPEYIKNDKQFFNDWILLSVIHFLKGYIEAFSLTQRLKVLEELIQNFNNPSSYIHSYSFPEYQNKKSLFDQIFKELRKKY